MITYTILSLYKRFEAYETLGALFRDTQKEMLEKTLYDLTSSEKAGKEIIFLLNAVNQFNNDLEKSHNEAS